MARSLRRLLQKLEYDPQIRVTENGEPSIFDLLKVYCDIKNPHESFSRIIKTNPEFKKHISTYKFPGRGQRDTPVLIHSKYMENLFHLSRTSIERRAKELGAPAPTTETRVRQAIFKFLQENGDNPVEHFYCSNGIVDIKTDTTAIEVKTVANWKSAVGQAQAYADCLGLYPEIALFGDGNYEPILDFCTRFGIACTTYPITGGYVREMINGVGGFCHSNYDRLRVDRTAPLYQMSFN